MKDIQKDSDRWSDATSSFFTEHTNNCETVKLHALRIDHAIFEQTNDLPLVYKHSNVIATQTIWIIEASASMLSCHATLTPTALSSMNILNIFGDSLVLLARLAPY